MKTEMMKRMSHFAFGSFLFFLSACGPSFQTGGDVDQGRQAMFRGDNQAALGYFQTGAQTDPAYIYGTELSSKWRWTGAAETDLEINCIN
jgi:hypothetical protein